MFVEMDGRKEGWKISRGCSDERIFGTMDA